MIYNTFPFVVPEHPSHEWRERMARMIHITGRGASRITRLRKAFVRKARAHRIEINHKNADEFVLMVLDRSRC